MSEKTIKPILTESIKVSADTVRNRFIGFDGALCVAGAKALGVSATEASNGEMLPVISIGIALVEASEAISIGDPVVASGTSTDAGKAAVASEITIAEGSTAVKSAGESGTGTITGSASDEFINGYAMDAATASGDIIRVKLV